MSKWTNATGLCVLGMALTLSACGAPIEADPGEGRTEVESSGLKNGTLVNGGNQWLGAVKVQVWWPSFQDWVLCSAQVSSRATVITAAHCVNGALGNVSSGNITAIITRETSSGQWLTVMPQSVAFTKYHPSYDGSAFHDVAVITASSPFINITQSDAIRIAKTAPSGQTMWAVGYGYYDVANKDGQGRAGQLTPSYSSGNHEYTFSATSTQTQICSGDSGGPLKMVSGAWTLFGWASWHDLDRSGDHCGHRGHWSTALDNYTWLEAAIGYDKCTELLTFVTCW